MQRSHPAAHCQMKNSDRYFRLSLIWFAALLCGVFQLVIEECLAFVSYWEWFATGRFPGLWDQATE
jgi:hypothetical protein